MAEPTRQAQVERGIAGAIAGERARLWRFIRERIPDRADAEDVLQDVFYEFILAYRMTEPIHHAGAWMLRVARNRVTDWFRKKRPVALGDFAAQGADPERRISWEDILPSASAGPDAVYARRVLLDELLAAIGELPVPQRDVFVAHQIEGRSFIEIARATGEKPGTLASRKHQAVLYLRKRLRSAYESLGRG